MSLHDRAVSEHRTAIADLLLRYGADRSTTALDGEEAFVAACLRLDRAAAERLVREHPDLIQSPTAMFNAASRDRVDAIELLLDLGVSVDVTDEQRQRPLHTAAASGAREATAFLIARGADVDARETRWNAPPIGFAAHHGRAGIIDLLSGVIRDVWHLAYHGTVKRLGKILAEEPARAREVSANGLTPLWWLPNDAATAVDVVELLLAHGADPAVRSKEGTTAADAARLRGLDQAADLIDAAAAGKK